MKNKYLFKTVITLCVAFFALLCPTAMNAQGTKVSGLVVDGNDEPLVGVFVSVKGTNVATSTDGTGAFLLSLPQDAKTLSFSMLGMADVDVAVENGKTNYKVTMAESTEFLEEAVAVGYGTIVRKNLTSSVSSVSGEELTQRASALNVVQGMAGKVAGVNIQSGSGRPGGHNFVRIRGKGSINASCEPLYVVDGVIDVDMNTINTSDIASIDVLKDAAASAMYGSKGANGVILITTKAGQKGQGTVTFDTKTGVSFLARHAQVLDAEGYINKMNTHYSYVGKVPDYLTKPYTNWFSYKKNDDGSYATDENGYLMATPLRDTDWYKEFFQTAFVTNNTLSFSQGNENQQIYASVGYQNMDGVIPGTNAMRLNGNINFKAKIAKWLDINAVANASRQQSHHGDYEGAIAGNQRDLPVMSPLADPSWVVIYDDPFGAGAHYTPIADLVGRDIYDYTNGLHMALAADFHIVKGLDLTVRGDYQSTVTASNFTIDKTMVVNDPTGPYAKITNTDVMKWSNEDYLTYTGSFFDNRLSSVFVLGASWYSTKTESSYAGALKLSNDAFSYHNLGAGTADSPSSSLSEIKMNSYYFRMNHSWKDRYMLGATLRADGASNFGANNKYGFFPSVSAGWAISEEPWFENAKDAVNQLKLRASYGEVGNAAISPYATLAQYKSGHTYLSGSTTATVVPSNLGNAGLTWETAKQLDFGLDMSFFKGRLQLIIDLYQKRNCDLLYEQLVPYSTGYSTAWSNIGEMRNRGIELTINAHTIDNREFKWDTDLVFSINQNKTIKINGDKIETNWMRCEEGQPWQQFYLHKQIGVWSMFEVEEAAKYGAKPGDPKYEDLNGDYKIDDSDRQYMGRVIPLGEASLVNTFFYKGFSLMIDFHSMFGYKVYRLGCQIDEPSNRSSSQIYMDNMWTPENQNTLVWAARSNMMSNPDVKYSNLDLYDGSFIRLKTASLSYDFKQSVFKNSKFVKGLNLGVTGENLYLFTKYPGDDPEVIMGSYNPWGFDGRGIEFCSYPKPMTITGNLRITF